MRQRSSRNRVPRVACNPCPPAARLASKPWHPVGQVLRAVTALAVVLLAAAGAGRAGQADPGGPYALVENFSAALPSSAEVRSEVDLKEPKVGLGAAHLEYRLPNARTQAQLGMEAEARRLPGPGLLKLWIKGDKSGNQVRFCIRHAKASIDPQGRRRYDEARDEWLEPVKLDFDEWREVSFDLGKLPEDRAIWWHALTFAPAPGVKEPRLEGTVFLDDMRLYPLKPKATAAVAAGLLGARVRTASKEMRAFLDVRNFTGRPAAFRVHLAATDRSENAVADRNFDVKLAAGEAKETALDLAPENVGLFLPPFRIAGDVLSPDLPEVSVRIEETLVLANSRTLFETFSDVRGGWTTRGGASPDGGRLRSFTVAEAYRFSPFTQTSVRTSRVDLESTVAKDDPAPRPPGPYAMRVDFDGDGAVFNGRDERDRYLPGDAFRAGFWVKGDLSGAILSVLVHDYSDMADFWEGGWKRAQEERTLCVLDFDTWRYIEIDLPGAGIGTNTRRGSTDGIDFPLEIAAFRIDARPAAAGQPPRRGTVLLGPILVWTQQHLAETLTVAVGYDDPNHEYAPAAGARATIQNAWPGGERTVKADWALLDRTQEVVAKGQQTLVLPPTEARTFRIELAPHAAAIAKATAPLTLAVTAVDAADASTAASHAIVLSRPDSRVTLATFEEDRGYLGTKGFGIKNAPSPGSAAARTSAEQAHGGSRSLAIAWNKETGAEHRAGVDPPIPGTFVAIDPPIPGLPTGLTMWVYGDGAGALLFPLIGDRRGSNKGATFGQWDYFLPRAAEGDLQDAVRVD